MTENDRRSDQVAKKSALFWMFFPVALLVTSVTGWLVMVKIAVDDPGFSVEPDYYKKAANYDAVIEQRAENSRLGYDVAVVSFAPRAEKSAHLILSVRGKDGAPIEGARVTADVLPVARAFEVRALTFRARGPGVFETDVVRIRTGLWEVRVRVEFRGQVFTQVLRPELALGPDGLSSGGKGRSPT
jgi:hypothetical protein